MSRLFVVLSFIFAYSYAQAAVVDQYALNVYDDHILGRAEKECINQGYTSTYASCVNQTAPADRCPHHDNYYKNCSQEQWCRNNNYTFLASDCKSPEYPVKICDNKFEIYRSCQKDTVKACKELGFSSKEECMLSDKRCEYDTNYGKCCDDCADFPYTLDNIPEGYVANGEVCTTCEGITKTKVKESACEGYVACQYGPLSWQTSRCLQGEKVLYSVCKTVDSVCREKGYTDLSCSEIDDEEPCAEDNKFKKCKVNCYKYAVSTYEDKEFIAEDKVDPALDSNKKELTSLYGILFNGCENEEIPTVTLNLDSNTLPIYRTLFKRNISNINFVLNFKEPLALEVGGMLKNVKIKVEGNPAECTFYGKELEVMDKVSISGNANLCSNLKVDGASKFTITGNVKGDVSMVSNAVLGIKGNLTGKLISKSYCEIFIKGMLNYVNKQNNAPFVEGIVFGCNTKAKIAGGIEVKSANILVKQYSLIDTPKIDLISTGASQGSASSLHIYKAAKIASVLDDTEYMLVENDDSSVGQTCDDKYVVFNSSILQADDNLMSLNSANTLDDKWQCNQLSKSQMRCN